MPVSLLSKHRSSLMALAMIWIAIRHSYFPATFKALDFFFQTSSYGGVDLFVFISGFGIYYAYKKQPEYKTFIKRRLLRVLPYSIVTCFLLFLLGFKSLYEAFVDGFGLAIWLRIDWLCWYTSFIILAYILTPFFIKIYLKKPVHTVVISIIVISAVCQMMNFRNIYIFFRFVVYILGIVFGHINDKNPNYNCLWLIPIMVFGWGLQYWLFHNLGNDVSHVLAFPFITPGMLVLTAYIVDKLKFVQKPLVVLSAYTYQFYLIHEVVLNYLYSYYEVLYRPGIYFDWLINIVGIIIALIFAIIIKKSIDFGLNKVNV